MKRASIDIGSNSILLLIGEFKEGKFTKLESESRVTSLGLNLDKNGVFDDGSMAESLKALSEYSNIISKYKIDAQNIVVTATEASRVAKNASIFYSKVLEQTGLNVQIISGEAEAYYSAKGILFDTNFIDKEVFILDIGGASSEVIKVDTETRDVMKSFSMPLGAVRATNWLSDGKEVYHFESIYNDYKNEILSSDTEKLYCVAGTMTSVANIAMDNLEFDEVKVHGFKLSTLEVVSIYESLKTMKSPEILKKYPFLGKRSKTIVGGLKVATSILQWLSVKEIEISTYGLRYGTILEGAIKDEFIIK